MSGGVGMICSHTSPYELVEQAIHARKNAMQATMENMSRLVAILPWLSSYLMEQNEDVVIKVANNEGGSICWSQVDNLDIMSLEGYGADMYVYLKHKGNTREPLFVQIKITFLWIITLLLSFKIHRLECGKTMRRWGKRPAVLYFCF
jgi:hypothetical protein